MALFVVWKNGDPDPRDDDIDFTSCLRFACVHFIIAKSQMVELLKYVGNPFTKILIFLRRNNTYYKLLFSVQ